MTTLKQNVEYGGLNSIDRRIERDIKEICLVKICTSNNPFKQTVKKYNLKRIDTWSDKEFLYDLQKLLN
jgi:hypothetical protein